MFNFNSIKVRLEHRLWLLLILLFHDFNSIKVRLEHPATGTSHQPPGFQFHKGTIRTGTRNASIKSLIYFNSIKVRLERSLRRRISVKAIFQFHKGTIRTYRTFDDLLSELLFQFHKGTIRTRLASSLRTSSSISIP